MARTPDEIIKALIGDQIVQLAVLTARVEVLEEELKLRTPVTPADKPDEPDEPQEKENK